METIQNIKDLKLAIQELEQMQASQYPLLKEQAFESTKPLNILKRTVESMQTNPVLTTHMVNAAICFVTDYLVKKVIVRTAENPLTELVETVAQIAITNVLEKNDKNIQVFTQNILGIISK